jgi:RNA polymerase sigma-70 factor (ECF subfamily)
MTLALIPVPADARMTESGSARSTDERDLVSRAQRGDVGAFETLYRANSGRVFALCLRMSGDRERAVDLLQDVFVRVWERITSFRGDAAFGTWVHQVAVTVVLEGERKQRRRDMKEESRSEDNGPVDTAPWKSAPSVEDRIDIDRAVAGLPDGPRRVFVLHDIEGYRHAEIARMTGLAEGTLRAQLHRARQLLMEVLER